MKTRKILEKVLFTMLIVLVGGGLLTLLIAANGNKKRNACNDYRIIIKTAETNSSRDGGVFVDEKDIVAQVTAVTGGQIRDEALSHFNLRQLEALLEDNVWVRDAELWFDNKDVLHISVTEREPVARIFTQSGNAFYIDKYGIRMPLSDKFSVRVPVFTAFTNKKNLSIKDSSMLDDIRKTAQYILENPFWMSQVAQVDIVQSCGRNCWQFEMVPVIGNHIVKLGNGQDMDQKFKRLFVFYQQVLCKTGFDRYNTIDVQYKGQVTGTRRDKAKIYIDSAVLKQNVEKLLKKVQEMQKEIPEKVKESGSEKPNREDSTETGRAPKAVMPKKN